MWFGGGEEFLLSRRRTGFHEGRVYLCDFLEDAVSDPRRYRRQPFQVVHESF